MDFDQKSGMSEKHLRKFNVMSVWKRVPRENNT